jgi:hypothetical protein
LPIYNEKKKTPQYKKILGKIFMTDKIYHIYAKGQCIYHSLSKDKFEETWNMLHRMVELLGTNMELTDLTYEELEANVLLSETASY